VIEAGNDGALALGDSREPAVQVGQVNARREGLEILTAVYDVDVAGSVWPVVLGVFITGDGDEIAVGRRAASR